MKNVNLLLVSIGLSISCFAQQPTIKWGEEFKLRRGSTDLEVVLVDKTGAYLQEGHLAGRSFFVIGSSSRESASLVKVDKNLTEVFRNDFNKELRGKEFVQFLSFQDKLFLISSDYNKQDRAMALYGAAVNKNTGELTGEFKVIATFRKEEKKDEIDFKFTYNSDSTRVVLVSSVTGREKNEYKVQELDKNLKPSATPVNLTNEFEAKKYQLQDLLYLSNRKVVLVGRVYEYEEGKKKKAKFLDFNNYNIRLYDEAGKQQTEINTTINGRWLSSTKLVQEKNRDLVLAAFYSDTKKGKTIDGLMVQRIDINDGKVTSNSDEKINSSMLSANVDNEDDDTPDEDESKEERKERKALEKMRDEGEGFSRYMQFRKIFYTPDNGLIILAEKYHSYVTTYYSSSIGPNGTMMNSNSPTTTYHYDSGDMMACKIDKAGMISWMKIIPKRQEEATSVPGIYRYGFSASFTDFFDNDIMPYYSSFGAMQTGNSIQIFMNDHPKNADVTQAGQKGKKIGRFGKSDCFLLTLDAGSGRITRKMFFSNTDVPTAMPRFGAIINNDMYIVGKDARALGKSKIAIGKISVK